MDIARPRVALTIAGSDSSGGAGIQADLKTFAAHGVYGVSAITAVTAQNTLGVTGFEALSADLVTAQIEAVVSDLGVHAAKTGMLPTAAIVEAVAAAVVDLEIPLLVVDPVMAAKSGDRLIDEEALAAIKAELVRRAFVVTPNIPEAEALAEITIATEEDRRTAARRIAALGASAVIVKGGHFASPDIVDLLYDGDRFVEFRAKRVAGRGTHGTGCTFAAALAARLALGSSLEEAVPLVQRYIAGAIRAAPGVGRGNGPMDHFWTRSDRSDRS
ncbi:MAG: bifunctional hydroxymethylpyrimidine kinase/phosphomethylpyrimidine kinase [Acidobacteria bacterium]|nr:bifunctional hydroxymethylpyrimidine kinase/phosphomethylpyrimidine kinase [Acidobacteriota bacterium]